MFGYGPSLYGPSWLCTQFAMCWVSYGPSKSCTEFAICPVVPKFLHDIYTTSHCRGCHGEVGFQLYRTRIGICLSSQQQAGIQGTPDIVVEQVGFQLYRTLTNSKPESRAQNYRNVTIATALWIILSSFPLSAEQAHGRQHELGLWLQWQPIFKIVAANFTTNLDLDIGKKIFCLPPNR